jgi:hypothetical protein
MHCAPAVSAGEPAQLNLFPYDIQMIFRIDQGE